MEIKLALALPRDHLSVPVARRVLASAMDALGIDPDVVHDIELALTEACTNVLDHAKATDEYEVSAGIDGRTCVVEVIDRSGDFDGSLTGLADAEPGAEGGRGVRIMRQLLDTVEFEKLPQGTVVRMEKELDFPPTSPIARLTDGRPPTEHGPWSGEAAQPRR